MIFCLIIVAKMSFPSNMTVKGEEYFLKKFWHSELFIHTNTFTRN